MKAISQTNCQGPKAQQPKNQLSRQLNALKDTADKNEKAAEIANQTPQPTASFPAVSPPTEKVGTPVYRSFPHRISLALILVAS